MSPPRDPDLEQRIRDLRRQGMSLNRISRTVDRDQAVVRAVLNPAVAASRAKANADWKKRNRGRGRAAARRYRASRPQTKLAPVADTPELYVIGSEIRRVVKIGQSVHAEHRLRELQTGSPIPLAILWRMPGGAAMERALHAYFSDRQTHGEHFDFGDDDPLALIQEAVERIELVAADRRLARAILAYLHAGGIPIAEAEEAEFSLADHRPERADVAERVCIRDLPPAEDALF